MEADKRKARGPFTSVFGQNIPRAPAPRDAGRLVAHTRDDDAGCTRGDAGTRRAMPLDIQSRELRQRHGCAKKKKKPLNKKPPPRPRRIGAEPHRHLGCIIG